MKKLLPWFGAVVILVIIFGTIYAVGQQAQRMDANYPQIQLAEDTAAALDQGAKPASLAAGKVDFGVSLAPFVIIYNKSGQVLAASGYLGRAIPAVPYGILSAANGKAYHFVTWQPRSDVRIAAVAVAAKNYYVLSGRSLTEVEKNETKTMQLSLLGGLASLVVLAAVFILKKQPAKR